MAYVIPSVLVYQQLESSGGVLNSTPDLHACIIGPCYSEIKYDPSSIESLVSSAAKSAVQTTGSILAGSFAVSVASVNGLFPGDDVVLEGAGVKGGPLAAKVSLVVGSTVTLDTAASTTVSNASLSKKGTLTNVGVSNVFALPNAKPGQKIVAGETQVWLNNVKVTTVSTRAEGHAFDNSLAVTSASTTGSGDADSSTVTVVATSGLVDGDRITIAGGAGGGVALEAVIVDIQGTTLTLDRPLVSSVSSAAVTKVNPLLVNEISNTYSVEAGDTVRIAYTDTSSTSKVFSSVVKEVTQSGGRVTKLSLVDTLPSDYGVRTTATTVSGSSSIAVASATGINTNDKVRVLGSTFDVTTTVSTISGSNITLAQSIPASQNGAMVYVVKPATIFVEKAFSNQLLPQEKPLSYGNNYDVSTLATTGEFTINVGPELVYGPIVSADVHVSYRALRGDLSGTIQEINDVGDIEGVLGEPSEKNPLALGTQIALANTVTSVRAIAVPSDDLAGYQAALELAENVRVYALVALTQDNAILSTLKAHVDQLSTPENASWRVALVNVEIPEEQAIGSFSENFLKEDAVIENVAGKFVLTSEGSTFLSDGLVPGDLIKVVSATPSTVVNSYVVQNVISNQQVIIDASEVATGVSFWAARALTKTQQAEWVAETSYQFNDRRVIHVQPDLCGINIGGSTKYLPGYYLACALAGMTAGFPVQQGFTNIGLAGITDLKHSNFYFSREQMNRMAEAGTFLIVQDVQGGIPYVRHELTTDISVLEYREYLVVKNWDYLSYYYADKIRPFIGSWNITTDTLNNIRQTIISSSELLKGKKLPKIGPPLVDYKLRKLEQSAVNKDHINAELQVSVVYPNNYTNLYLII